MKNQLSILLLFFFNCSFIYGQIFIKTDIPCNKELLKKTPGQWLPTSEDKYNAAKLTVQERKEIMNRVFKIHQRIKEIYPSPTAVDANLFWGASDNMYASELKMNRKSNGVLDWYNDKGIPVITYNSGAGFCAYDCGINPNEIMRGKGCETATFIEIQINRIDEIFISQRLDDDFAEIMRIDNRQIKIMAPIVGKWKGYDVYNSHGIYNPNEKIVFLFHREGVLPYIPVTRKQYLERCILGLPLFFDKTIKAFDHPEGLASLMDNKERLEQIKKTQKIRDDVLKYYQDELAATTKAGKLDEPAVVSEGIASILISHPVFTTTEKKGRMLVTENPAYIRKDLPKYIPQIIVYYLNNCSGCYADPSLNPYKLLDEKFPIEKLQAMIDK